MKFHLGKVLEDVTFLPEQGGWVSMKEPSPWLAQLLALPIAVSTGIGLTLLWIHAGADWCEIGGLGLLTRVIGLVFVHETIHVLLHPHFGASRATHCCANRWICIF